MKDPPDFLVGGVFNLIFSLHFGCFFVYDRVKQKGKNFLNRHPPTCHLCRDKSFCFVLDFFIS